jgi:hypothetical protein
METYKQFESDVHIWGSGFRRALSVLLAGYRPQQERTLERLPLSLAGQGVAGLNACPNCM